MGRVCNKRNCIIRLQWSFVTCLAFAMGASVIILWLWMMQQHIGAAVTYVLVILAIACVGLGFAASFNVFCPTVPVCLCGVPEPDEDLPLVRTELSLARTELPRMTTEQLV